MRKATEQSADRQSSFFAGDDPGRRFALPHRKMFRDCTGTRLRDATLHCGALCQSADGFRPQTLL